MRKLFFSLTVLLLMVCACSEQIDTSAKYVFKYHTIASYLEAHPDYSQYVSLLKMIPINENLETSTVYQLLTARGNYTVFAITNDAIDAYLQDLVNEGLITEPSWDSFTDSVKLDSIRTLIVKNSIIDGFDREDQRYSIDMVEKNIELPLPTLNDHRLTINWDKNNPDSFYVNKICPIDPLNHDIPVINGYIHQLHKVIAPKDESCARYLQNILDNKTEGYLLMARVIQACGLMNLLNMVRDEEYELKYLKGEIPDMEDYQAKSGGDKSATAGDPDAHAPEHRKYGYTIFAETDEYWHSQNIDPAAPDALEQLVGWIQRKNMYFSEDVNKTDNNYTSPDNILYRWVTYHILPMRIPANKLVYHCNEIGFSTSKPTAYTLPVYEWYSTIGEGSRRLLKLYESKESEGVYINRFPVLDNSLSGTGHELSCDREKTGVFIDRESENAVLNDIINACIYPITSPLAYTDAVRDELAKERIRFDLFAMFPEAITNNIRRADSREGKFQHVYIPQDRDYKYFENMSILNEDTHFIHYNGYQIDWPNYCQDEDKAFGHYDIMFTLPPVPKRGTYELRYKVLATTARGIVQVYFGSNPNNLPAAGIPINMGIGIARTYLGASVAESDLSSWHGLDDASFKDDEDAIIEIDHKLRNHGLMKAGKHEYGEGKTARDDARQTRHILVRQTLDPRDTYYIRFKSVLESTKKELYFDYFEWCPKEIYDNPSKPEDVW
ncbi:MAG: fasciclin domain-containing protein [Bacteroidaceae bacterium]|nr:fasciclin domain-containing protein [Bacteroidaceae bacterium]